MPRQLTKKEQKIIKLAKSGGTDKELAILDEIDDLENKFDTSVTELKKDFKETVEKIKSDVPNLDNFLKSVKGKQGDGGDPGIDGKTPTKDELLKLIKPLIPQIKDGHTPTNSELLELIRPLIPDLPEVKDGKTPTNKELIDLINPLIPPLPEVKDGSPDKPEEIVDKLQSLEGKERLDKSAIKGLETSLGTLDRKFVVGTNMQRLLILDASGAQDGSNKDYTFAEKPTVIIINGSSYRENHGWLWSGATTATLDFALISDDDIYGTR